MVSANSSTVYTWLADNGDEWKTLIEEILCGPQGIIARVFDRFDDPLGLPGFGLHNEYEQYSRPPNKLAQVRMLGCNTEQQSKLIGFSVKSPEHRLL